MTRRFWTEGERELLRARYPHVKTETLAAELGRSLTTTYQQAHKLGLVKSAEYLASPDACRLRRGDNTGAATRFKKGLVPWNVGKQPPGYTRGRMRETQFKKGERRGVALRNYCPVGTVRPDNEGYLRIKVRESLPTDKFYGFGNVGIWPLLQRHVWEQQHGPIPPSHTIVFRDRDRANCAIENLECISRAELMRRNTVHNLPPELKDTIMLLGRIKRKLGERERAEEHDDGPAQPSV